MNVYRIKGTTFVVSPDEEYPTDLGYAPGVLEHLRACYERGDYYTVEAVDDDGVTTGSCSSMAGYGSPRTAAETFQRDYFNGDAT